MTEDSSSTEKSVWPNCCPYCGTHVNRGGCGDRFGVLHCAHCNAEYNVEFVRVYPPSEERFFELYHREFLESKPWGAQNSAMCWRDGTRRVKANRAERTAHGAPAT